MTNEPIKWTDAYRTLRNEGATIVQARFALGTLLDGELELEQQDDTERVITAAELQRARQVLATGDGGHA